MIRRLGRRGSILLILTVIDVMYGASLIRPSAEERASEWIAWLERFGPTWVCGLLWLFVGVILCVSAFMRHDAVGYATAIGWKIIWGATTLASWMYGDVVRGWIFSIIWFVFAAMIVIIAGWPEPVAPPNRVDEDDG